MSAATLLPVPSAATLIDLAERCGWAIEALRCVGPARAKLDPRTALTLAFDTGRLLHVLSSSLEDAGNGPSRDRAKAWAYEVNDGATDARLLAGVGWCRDLAASLRAEVANG